MSFLVFTFFGLKINNLKEVRKKYKELISKADSPIIICSNHLTYADSAIQSIAFNTITSYLWNFKSLPWNLPEKKNFSKKWYLRVICYLGKCITVERGVSSAKGKETQKKMLYVLKKGDIISIFPEGKRSRTGKIDTEDYSYGVGQILEKCPETKVICVYMRGKKNGGFSKYPQKNEEFSIELELISPSSNLKGLRKVRDYSSQVINQLVKMENRYHAN